MKIFQTVVELQKHLLEINQLGQRTIGFVPTMGALHQGHLSLIDAARKESDYTVCSIFVNPTQFNDPEDFKRYPIQIDRDLEMLLEAKCDVAFVPNVEEIYPHGTLAKVDIDLGFIGTTLEAAHRPGHFEGVLQVVKRLLDIVQPDKLFLGQKDYQQCMVLQRLVQHCQLPVEVVICPTLREPDGLAMSSRNVRLSAEERSAAVKLSKALNAIREHIRQTPLDELLSEQQTMLSADPLISVEYLVVVHGETLEPVDTYKQTVPLTALVAAKVGPVRLIDNLIIT